MIIKRQTIYIYIPSIGSEVGAHPRQCSNQFDITLGFASFQNLQFIFCRLCVQCPALVLFVWKKFFNFVVSNGLHHSTDILKVFSQSLLENVVVFKSDRITNNTYFLYICYRCTHIDSYGILQVWGIVSFIIAGFYHSLLTNERNHLHTFFLS